MTKRLIIALVAIALFVLVAILPVSATKMSTGGTNYYYQVAPDIGPGAMVFIGESHLNLQPAGFVDGDVVGWWASAANICTSPASKTVTITSSADYTVAAADYGVGPVSDWYKMAGSTPVGCGTPVGALAALRAADPTLDVAIWAPGIAADVTGKSVTKGTDLQFGIVTNQYAALGYSRTPILGTSKGDGYIDLKVRNESGAVLNQLYTTEDGSTWATLTSINVSTQPYYWGVTSGLDNTSGTVPATAPFMWKTATTIGGQPSYAPGTYTVWAESLLNDMKSRYTDASGAAYTGKTVSAVKTVTLVSDTVKITVNKDTVVRGKPFSVTITGRPSTTYHLWVKGTADMAGGPNDMPPMVTPYQAGVTQIATYATAADQRAAAIATPGSALGYTYQNAYPGSVVFDDVCHVQETGFGNMVAANVQTTTSGTRTVQFDTTSYTKPWMYTIHVEQNFSGSFKSNEVNINVEKGVVTIVAAGDQSYNRGEDVSFSGVNTESYTTYLFITGPNLNQNGAELDNPIVSIINQDPSTFVQADVASDNTWSYDWTTTTLPLNSGTYTIYAVSQPVDRAADHIANTAYGTVTIYFDANNPKTTKIGIYQNGLWYLDSDGSYAYNTGDASFAWGNPGDKPVLGDWNGDGRKEIGVYNNGIWYLDYNGNGVYDGSVFDRTASFGSAGYKPVVGDWNGNGKDKIGAELDGFWAIDYNGNYQWDGAGTDRFAAFGQTGDNPVVGDWDGTGKDKIGSEKDGFWAIDYNGNYLWDGPPTDRFAGFGQLGDKPVIGDWYGTGKDKIGSEKDGFWALDYNGNYLWDGSPTDRFAGFGQSGDNPVVGDWDGTGKTKIGSEKDGFWAIDYNGNYQWDGVGIDRFAGFGSAGDSPIVGKW